MSNERSFSDTVILDPEFEYLRAGLFEVGEGYVGTSKGESNPTRLARFITNCPDALWVDHENGNKLDNRRINLRVCTPQNNNRNRRKTSRPTSSIYKGVSYRKSKKHWRAMIMVNYQAIELGCFQQEVNAAKAYNEAAKKYFGEFAVLNIIPND